MLDKKKIYANVMKDISKKVKKALNEAYENSNEINKLPIFSYQIFFVNLQNEDENQNDE